MQKNNTGLVPLTIRELKKQCILRGIPFEHVSDGVPELNSWLDRLSGNEIDPHRLVEYDAWITKLIESGRQASDAGSLLHKNLMFSYEEDKPEIKTKSKPKKAKKPKAKIGLFGFREGTKKHRVAELMVKGCSIKMIKKRMTKEFGDVNDQSLKIWTRKIELLMDEKE